ncbi:HNH/ENDO VII family nuclease [Nocardioides sp. zg-1228]|uniref:HNH/ENDO VII family nuclease n=1 Tax=Nocardioides sp. zg-1228 TaxID=2763008 RepID=UPI001642E9DE|nr:HNH/ENDO VII family nuclease [Nocardioides sp. zg-1228]MBC2932240.1 HNH/ENDO VII family nuclease [Nocardioides sp. zg-1228]QSF57768.1 HNH/ENDO VII family nuclease [Nocardioides sp. zg-1228]
MRIEVDSGGYTSAATSLETANGLAADAYETLTGKLGGFGGMGGDDKSSEDFVPHYDSGAAAAVTAIADLVTALGSLAIIAEASGANHADADAGSVHGSRGGPGAPEEVDPVEVAPYSPPTASGANAEDTPQFWDVILDYLEGYTWPGADTGRLGQAASAWDAAASSLDGLRSYCEVATTQLGNQRSPEIPAAKKAVGEVKQAAADIASACRELATACRDYANQVEETKSTVKGLMKDLAIEVGATVVVAGIGSLFTAGAAAGGGAALIAARAANYARRVITALAAIRGVRAVFTIVRTVDKLTDVTRILRKFRSARAMRRRPTGKLPKKGKPNSYGYDKNGDRLPYANSRPDYGKGQVDEVWENAKDENGEVWVLDKDGNLVKIDWRPGDPQKDVWDMGHVRGEEYRKLRDEYLSGKITKEEFLERYQAPRNYEVAHPGRNRSHVDEAP